MAEESRIMIKTQIKNDMTVMRFFFITLILLTVSCSQGEKSKSNQSTSFNIFMEKFGSDEFFQLSRVRFPIEYYFVDIEDVEEKIIIEREDWQFTNFSEDFNAINNEVDGYKVVIEKSNNKVSYFRKGVDNGIWIEYIFELKESKWYLVKVNDRSN